MDSDHDIKDPQCVRIGLPKGSLEEATLALFAKAGFKVIKRPRSYIPVIDDPKLEGRFIRAQEMSHYVELGFFDCGLTGYDWIVENGSDVVTVCDLAYSRTTNVRARWVLAVPEDSPIKIIEDLEGKRIATEVVSIVRNFLKKHNVNAHVEFSWGATEVKVPDLVDAIVDLTETGSSLQANRLRIVTTILSTHTQLIANRKSWEDLAKRTKIENLALLLRASLEAENKVGLKLNIQKDHLDRVLSRLPALRSPTLSPLNTEGWVAVETIIEEIQVREIIPELKRQGAEGIIEYPLNKLVP